MALPQQKSNVWRVLEAASGTHMLAAVLQVAVGEGGDATSSTLTDADIAQLLQQHFNISPASFLAAATQPPPHASTAGAVNGSSSSKAARPAGSAAQQQQGAKGASKPSKAGSSGATKSHKAAGYESVEAFVGVMSKLLDMERQAEVEAAQEATSLCSTSAAQVG